MYTHFDHRRTLGGLPALLRILCLVLVASLICSPRFAYAADRFDADRAKIEELAKSGDTDAAIRLNRQLVTAARRALKKTDPRVSEYMSSLASFLLQHDNRIEAEKLAHEALTLARRSAGADRAIIDALEVLAALEEGGPAPDLAKSESTLAEALAVAEGAFGPDSPEANEVQGRMAALMQLQGRNAEASQLLAKLANAEQKRVEERPNTAQTAATSAPAEQAPAEAQSEGAKQAEGGAEPQSMPQPQAVPQEGPPAGAPAAPDMTTSESASPPAPPNVGAAEPTAPLPTPPAEEAAPAKKHKFRAARRVGEPEVRAGEAAPAAPVNAQYHVVELFFGTNRKQSSGAARVSFTSSENPELTLGVAIVTIPPIHQVPEVERPWSLRIPGTEVEISLEAEDPTHHFMIKSIETLPEDQFLARVKEHLARSKDFKDQALVFVHGFYNKFDDALYRTAQIAYDMGFDGAPFMFSWPSAGTLDAYLTDRGKAQRAGAQLRAFLDLVARKTGAKRVTVIAHSMGNLPLMEALDETVALGGPSPSALIDDVVLAAPDIGRKEFAAMAEHMSKIKGGVTLYAASNDLALEASRTVNGEGRAGDTRPGGPLLLPHIDTIDATGASMQMFRLNHYYVAESSAVLCDLERLLNTGQHPPDLRSKILVPVADGEGKYYTFRQ